jgi:uncharacterized glyoxalase superfamily protein PhnB
MTDASTVKLWPSMSLLDAEGMMTWLRAIGFVEHSVYREEDDPSRIVHAEFLWPGGGGIMFGSHEDGHQLLKQPGSASAYLVTDEPDRVLDAAVAAGGRVLRPVADQDYGGRSGSVADPEGNVWSIGSYQPT